MKTKIALIIAVLLVMIIGVGLWVFAEDPITYLQMREGYISPSDISISGDIGFVSDATSKKVYKIDLTDNSLIAEYPMEQVANAVYAEGETVFILEGALEGNIIKLNSDFSSVIMSAETGHTPNDMLINREKIYVACRYSNQIYVYNENDLSLITKIDVPREPMALTLQGDNLYVATHLSSGPANADIVSAKVVVIDTEEDKVTKEIPLLNGSGGVKGICTSPNGEYVYVSNILARYTYPTTQLDRGWINTNSITIIETNTQEVLTAVLLDSVEEGAGNPWGVECFENNLIVSIAGTNEIMVVDTEKMFRKIEYVKNERDENVKNVEEIANYIPFLEDCKTRILTENVGLRNLSIKDGKAYICGYFSGNITVYDINERKILESISLGEQPEEDSVRMGERIWNDANSCYQKWESCASCHPDARVDALNWDNVNDGLGNPKNAKSMMYSHRTPYVMTTGIRENAEVAVRAGMKYIQFNKMEDDEVLSIDHYLMSLSPIQSPYLNRDGGLTDNAKEGKKLFEELNCISCHSGPIFSDMKRHRTADKIDNWEYRDFDTPSLVEAWATGPWFAGGQFATLREAVVASVPKDKKLSDKQLDQLTEYVASIGNSEEYYGVEQIKFKDPEGLEHYNRIEEGNIFQMSVRKQHEAGNAVVSVKLFDESGKELKSKEVTLKDMKVGDQALIPLDFDMDDSVKKIVVSIKDENGGTLATDFVITA